MEEHPCIMTDKVDGLVSDVREVKAMVEKIDNRTYDMHGRVSKVEIKAGTWGGLAGLMVAIAAILFKMIGG